MYSLKEFFNKEPVAIGAAVIAVANVLQLFGVIDASADQLAALNLAIGAVVGLFQRSKVSPTA